MPNHALRKFADVPERELSLIHVTSVGYAREILRAGQMETRVCKVLGRSLVYFFALKPAYKMKGSRERSELLDYFPFVFVVRPQHLGPPFHVYPFDTGGAMEGAFDDGASPGVYLEDYELDPSLNAVSKQIAWAFELPANYYDGKLKPDLADDLPDWNSVPKSFAKIARLASVGYNAPDGRASAIEVAYARHVSIDQIALAVMPAQFLEDDRGENVEMKQILDDAKIDTRSYQWQPNREPQEFQSEINRIVREYLVLKGQL